MPDETDLVIDIPQDEPVAAPETVTEPEKVVSAEAGIDDLKKQLDEVNKRREEESAQLRADAAKAKQEAAQAKQEATKFQSEHERSQYDTIVNAIDAVNREAELAVKEYEEAMSSGEYGKAAQAQRKISRAESRLNSLEGAKDTMDQTMEARKNAKPEQIQSSDPVEAYINQFSPRSQRWLNNHREFVTDTKKNRRLLAAHNEAEAEDFIPDTDAYFDFIERKLGLKEAPEAEQVVEPQKQKVKQVMPAAPVSRESSSPNGGARSSQITLTAGEQRAATDGTIVWNYDDPNGKFKKGDAIGLREMAIRKAALQKTGAYDRSYTEQ